MYRFTGHSLSRGAEASRPDAKDVLWGIGQDRPRIHNDDHGQGDPRGPVVEIHCEASDGRTLAVRINYGANPVVVITQFWVEQV